MEPEPLVLRVRDEQLQRLLRYLPQMRETWEMEPVVAQPDGDTLLPLLPHAVRSRDVWDWILVQLRRHDARYGEAAPATEMEDARDLDTFTLGEVEALVRTLDMYDAQLLLRAVTRVLMRRFALATLDELQALLGRPYKIAASTVYASDVSFEEYQRTYYTHSILALALGHDRAAQLPLRRNYMTYTRDDQMAIYPLHTRPVVVGDFAHAVVLASDGLYAFGFNAYGQLGLGTTDAALEPARVPFVTRIVGASCGVDHTVALDALGQAYGCGRNDSGQLGALPNTTEPTLLFTPLVLPEGRLVLDVACGATHTVLLTDRGLYVSGGNDVAQLGLGDIADRYAFVPLAAPGAVIWVVCGPQQTFVCTTQGLYACGRNELGQLGVGNRVSPVTTLTRVQGVDGARIRRMTSTHATATFLTYDGDLYASGMVPWRRGYIAPTARRGLSEVTAVWATGDFILVRMRGVLSFVNTAPDEFFRLAVQSLPDNVMDVAMSLHIGTVRHCIVTTTAGVLTYYGGPLNAGEAHPLLGGAEPVPYVFHALPIALGTTRYIPLPQRALPAPTQQPPQKKPRLEPTTTDAPCRLCDNAASLTHPLARHIAFCSQECMDAFDARAL